MMQEEQGWKVEQYKGLRLSVRAEPRNQENPALDGHGREWDFLVKIDEEAGMQNAPDGAATMPTGDAAAIRSDPNVLYGTEAIALHMGFIKARELVDHRTGAGTNQPNQPAEANKTR